MPAPSTTPATVRISVRSATAMFETYNEKKDSDDADAVGTNNEQNSDDAGAVGTNNEQEDSDDADAVEMAVREDDLEGLWPESESEPEETIRPTSAGDVSIVDMAEEGSEPNAPQSALQKVNKRKV